MTRKDYDELVKSGESGQILYDGSGNEVIFNMITSEEFLACTLVKEQIERTFHFSELELPKTDDEESREY